MFQINEFLEKVTFILENIGDSFETSGWIFFTKVIIMFQIFHRSDVMKKKVGYPSQKR